MHTAAFRNAGPGGWPGLTIASVSMMLDNATTRVVANSPIALTAPCTWARRSPRFEPIAMAAADITHNGIAPDAQENRPHEQSGPAERRTSFSPKSRYCSVSSSRERCII